MGTKILAICQTETYSRHDLAFRKLINTTATGIFKGKLMKNNEHISHLFEVCDEIFNKQRVALPTMVRDSDGFVLFPNFPAEGWKVEVHLLEGCFETHLYRKGSGTPFVVEITGATFQELETQLEIIHYRYFEEGETTPATPNATLTLNATTPTSILRDLAARALGWVDRPYDPLERGSVWHCDAQNAPFGPTLHKAHWKPDLNEGQTLALIANLGITVTAVQDEDDLKTIVLIEAAKIGARKLGEGYGR